MRRTRSNAIIIVLLTFGIGFMAQGCKTRKCGCGSDIMGVYKVKKRHKY